MHHHEGRLILFRYWRFRAASGWIGSRPEGSVRFSRLPFPKPQRINPPRWIRRIRIKIQATRITDRVFADKPSGLWIIVPIPIVVQPCFVIVVLALKPDRVGQALALCTFRALFFDFYPYFVWRALGAVQKFSTYSRRLSFNPS